VFEHYFVDFQFTGIWNMGNQEGIGIVEYPQMKFRGYFHLGCVCITGSCLTVKAYSLNSRKLSVDWNGQEHFSLC
jgi:hypothetical protein